MIKAGPPVKKFTGAGSIWGPDMLYLYCTIAICCMYPGSRKRAAKGSGKTKTCYFENSLQSRNAYDWRPIRSRNSDSINER